MTGDLLDRAALRRAMDGVDTVFHLAALYSYARARRRSDGAHQRRGHARRDRGGRRAPRRAHVLVRDVRARRRPARHRGGRARGVGTANPLQAHEDRRRADRARRCRPRRGRGRRQPHDARRARRPAPHPDRKDGRRRGRRPRTRIPRRERAQHRGRRGRRARPSARARARRGGPPLSARRREPRDARGLRDDRARRRPAAAPRSRCRGAPPTRPPGSPRACAPSPPCWSSTRSVSRVCRCASTTLAHAASWATPPRRRRTRSRAPSRTPVGQLPVALELLARQRLALAIRAALWSQPADDEADHREQRAEQQHRRRPTAAPRYRAIGAGRTRRGRERRSMRPGCGVDAPPPA